jgi:hypothetical protein
MRERAVMSRVAGREAAVILRRVTEALPMPASVAAYLRGHADALGAASEGSKRPRKREPPVHES